MLVTSRSDVERVIEAVTAAPGVVLDTETSSLRPLSPDFKLADGSILAGLAVRPLDRDRSNAFYVPVQHEDCPSPQATQQDIWDILNACRGKPIVFHNAPFDVEVLFKHGTDFTNERLLDMMVMARLVHEDLMSYKLKDLGAMFVDPGAKTQENELKAYMRKYKLQRYSQVPPAIMEPYAVQDVLLTEGLLRAFKPEVDARDLNPLLRMESRLSNTLIKMEIAGIKCDVPYVEEAIKDIDAAIAALERECYRIAGHEFNVDSAKQLGEVFHGMGVRSAKTTASGAESWDIIALALIDHPLAKYVRMFRTYRKLRNTYLQNYLDMVDENSFIHCQFRQSGARTGRMSCTNPNLQNIPRFEGFSGSKTGAIAANITSQIETGITYSSTKKHGQVSITKAELEEQKRKLKELVAAQKKEIPVEEEDQPLIDEEYGAALAKVRGAFVASAPDEDLWFIDFQQMEMRVFADYANEKALMTAFDFGLDIHEITAVSAFGDLVPKERGTQEYKWYRNMGKQIAFGLIYGMGIKLLAIEIRKTQEEARGFQNKYFEKFPRAKMFIDSVSERVVDQGYLANKYGRRRYLGEDKIYVGVNFLVQGTCADMVKSAMNKIDDMIEEEGFKSRMLLSIHDELIFSVKRDEVDRFIPKVVELMTDFDGIIKAKMAVDVEWGERWSDKVSIGCKTCEGRGFLVDLGEEALTELLVSNQFDQLYQLDQKPCLNCNGRGYDLERWREKVA